MRELRTSARYRRDERRIRRGKDIARLDSIVVQLLSGKPVDPRHRVHQLAGDWYPLWECHVEFNWLLVWEDDGDAITLRYTGTHDDIFGG